MRNKPYGDSDVAFAAILIGAPLLAIGVMLRWEAWASTFHALMDLRLDRVIDRRWNAADVIGGLAALIGASLVVGGIFAFLVASRRAGGH